MARSQNRFARHNTYRPPSGFRPTSPCPAIVHCLSGLSKHACPQNFHPKNSIRAMVRAPRRDAFPLLNSLSLRIHDRVFHSNTRTLDELLSPCFKTGGVRTFPQHRFGAAPRPRPQRRTNAPICMQLLGATLAAGTKRGRPRGAPRLWLPPPWFHTCRKIRRQRAIRPEG